MAYRPKRPKLTQEELIFEVHKRTGYNIDAVYKIIWTLNEVVKDCMLNCVEVPFGDIGVFTWKQFLPRKNVRLWNVPTKSFDEPADVDGFRRQTFRAYTKWLKTLKEASRYKDGEQQPE